MSCTLPWYRKRAMHTYVVLEAEFDTWFEHLRRYMNWWFVRTFWFEMYFNGRWKPWNSSACNRSLQNSAPAAHPCSHTLRLKALHKTHAEHRNGIGCWLSTRSSHGAARKHTLHVYRAVTLLGPPRSSLVSSAGQWQRLLFSIFPQPELRLVGH